MSLLRSPWTPLMSLLLGCVLTAGGTCLGPLVVMASIMWLVGAACGLFAAALLPASTSDTVEPIRFRLRTLFVLTAVAAVGAWCLTFPLPALWIAFAVLLILFVNATVFECLRGAVALLSAVERAIEELNAPPDGPADRMRRHLP